MTIIAKARLRIRDQGELLNQIAGTYKDFFRAAMEYVDNAIDAAAAVREKGVAKRCKLSINVDTAARSVTFTDNCGGMTASELCGLLSEVGRSRKKAVSWANGQFGFGVHAFRAFARQATFTSRVAGGQEARIKIDRNLGDDAEVPCERTSGRELPSPGTRVEIAKFDSHVFKRGTFVRSLVAELEHHFDDVLRSGLITIAISEDDGEPYECRYLDFAKLPGSPLKKTIKVSGGEITVDLRVLDRVQEDRLPILTNKGRRIQAIADLKSFKTFARSHGASVHVWSNPFVVGGIEINDLCSPNLSRDDLRDSPGRDAVYEALGEVQKELEHLVDDRMNSKTQESLKKLGSVLSDCLSRILRGFRLQFDQVLPSSVSGESEGAIVRGKGDRGSEHGWPTGTRSGPSWTGSGEKSSSEAGAGPGYEGEDDRAGDGGRTNATGTSQPRISTSPGPRIEFQNHAGEDRVIDLGNSLIVNTQHPDFIARNQSRTGKIRLDARLLNYISLVVAPPCVHRLFERRGRVPNALEVGSNVVDLSTKLEGELVRALVGQELDLTGGDGSAG
jgi:hypothetical protein